MKKIFIHIVFFIFLIMPSYFCQSINLGFKFESLSYHYTNTVKNKQSLYLLPIPISGYIKAGILFFDQYEIELKGGFQIGEIFAGPEYAVTAKCYLIKGISPLISYLKHFNGGDSRTGSGIYSNAMKFLGAGIEANLSDFIGVDLIYYIPIGEKGLEYTIDFGSSDDRLITTSRIDSMIKLGFIFNFHL